MAKPVIKIITIGYGLFNNPNQHRIDKAIRKWESKGYKLTGMQNNEVGCFGMLMTLGWARGKTILTFRLE